MPRWIAAAGALVVSLDSMMNIAFPAIATAFAAPAERMRWVIVCYVFTYALTAFAGGAVADRIGHVAVFRAGAALSAVAFLMGGASAGFSWLLLARVVQGFGCGLIYGTAPALSTAGAPAALRGRRLGFLNGSIALGGALGPLVAGLLVQAVGWRAVFHVRVPLALAVLAGTAAALRPEPVDGQRRAVTVADVVRGPVLWACMLAFVARGSIFAIWLLVPFYLVEGRGLGPTVGGMLFMLTPLGSVLAAPLAGRVADRAGARAPAFAGLLLEGLGLALLAAAGDATPLPVVAVALFTAGFGIGFFEVPNMTVIMAAFTPSQQGAAGGLAFLARTLGVVVGVSLLGELFAARQASVGFFGAFSECLVVAALAVVALAALDLTRRRQRP
jgi:MFS family permease